MTMLLRSPYPESSAPAGVSAFVKTVAALTNTTSGSSQVVTLGAGISVPAGNTIFLGIGGGTSGSTIQVTGITDSKGNTYELSVVSAGVNTPLTLARAYITNALAPGDTITITYNTLMPNDYIIINEFSGVANAAVDKTASAFATSTTPNSGNTATTVHANELLIGLLQTNWGDGETPSDIFTPATVTPAWTKIGFVGLPSVIGRGLLMCYRYVSATGAYNLSGSISSSRQWRATIGTFQVPP